MEIIEGINAAVMGPAMLVCIFGAGVIFLFVTRFFYILHPIAVFKALFARGGSRGEGVAPFGALCTALAGTLGVGNIVGVSTAIAAGGAGAVFWMWVSGIFAMVLKYAEVVLGVRHRRASKAGFHGGAPYYVCDTLGRRAGVCFALLMLAASLTIGCSVQARAVADAADIAFGLHPALAGGMLSALCLAVLLGGVRSVSSFTARMIPLLTLAFIVMSLASILARASELPALMCEIFDSALDFRAAGGGLLGFFGSRAVRYGVMRGISSNEAGCGTAPTAHAAASTDSCARQGLWGLVEVAIDTLLLCTLTALAILINRTEGAGDGIAPVIAAFEGVWGGIAPAAVAAAIFFFALSTMICWSYYGLEALRFISPRRGAQRIYLALFCLMIIPLSLGDTLLLWELSDLVLALMTVFNLAVLVLRADEISGETALLFKKSGKDGRRRGHR